LEVERLISKEGKDIKLDKVLLLSDEKGLSIGRPYVKGASILCEVLGEKLGPKTISFKYRRRHASSKRQVGHRHIYTVLKVNHIVT